MAFPLIINGAVMVRLPAPRVVVIAAAVLPLIVKLPPEIPTACTVLMVSDPIVRSPLSWVLVEFEEPLAEKMMSESVVKSAVGVPVELLDQLLPADHRVPFEPSQ